MAHCKNGYSGEVGAQGLYIFSWHGLWVPKGTLKDIIVRLIAAVVDALADSVVRGERNETCSLTAIARLNRL
jgi:hypothetical protein